MTHCTGFALLAIASALSAGCGDSHLVFLENSHMGLKASFEPNNPSPAEIDIGWRRAVFAMVPKKSNDTNQAPGSIQVSSVDKSGGQKPDGGTGDTGAAPKSGDQNPPDTAKTPTVEIYPDPNELMSMYAVYKGNIGFGDPIDIYHFMATGVAASYLLASHDALRDLVTQLNDEKASKGGN